MFQFDVTQVSKRIFLRNKVLQSNVLLINSFAFVVYNLHISTSQIRREVSIHIKPCEFDMAKLLKVFFLTLLHRLVRHNKMVAPFLKKKVYLIVVS